MKIHELGHVVLYVTNLERSVHFYRDILGFPLVGEMEIGGRSGAAAFSSGRTHHEMLLIEVGGSPRQKHAPEPGLYHIGFKVADSDEELKEVLKELKKNNVLIGGMSDHTVTHSIYIEDPDGNEIELYADVSDEWKTNPEAVLAPIKRLNLE
jgi:catechol 2,3-dioxygenase